MQKQLAPLREAVDATIERRVRESKESPPSITEAVLYAVLGKGKRLRPLLLILSGEAVGGNRDHLLPAACAVEMIHTFSLIHDDLPALDDDDLRRGRPTLHVKFDEATAILAGDALLNLAFETLARFPEGDDHAPSKLKALQVISQAVGLNGMIAGQVLDLEFEGKKASGTELERIHRLKTGALITASCLAGGTLARASTGEIKSLERYGRALGLAFQMTDDILDVEGSALEIGKSPGKDLRSAKATYPSVWGLAATREMVATQVEEALEAAATLGEPGAPLAALASGITDRKS
jgi:geranylgeranyl pyrophosphate synthase